MSGDEAAARTQARKINRAAERSMNRAARRRQERAVAKAKRRGLTKKPRRCRRCGAAIKWRVSTRGLEVAVNAEPDPAGWVLVEDEMRCVVLSRDEVPEHLEGDPRMHVPHLATCTDPRMVEWRQAGKARAVQGPEVDDGAA